MYAISCSPRCVVGGGGVFLVAIETAATAMAAIAIAVSPIAAHSRKAVPYRADTESLLGFTENAHLGGKADKERVIDSGLRDTPAALVPVVRSCPPIWRSTARSVGVVRKRRPAFRSLSMKRAACEPVTVVAKCGRRPDQRTPAPSEAAIGVPFPGVSLRARLQRSPDTSQRSRYLPTLKRGQKWMRCICPTW